MITTTQAWKNYFVNSSVCGIQMQIKLTNGVSLTINTDRVMEGSLNIHDEICQVGEIDIGSTVAQEISFDISNHDGRMSGYNFNGAKCTLYLTAGTAIQKGVYYLYVSNKVGRVISLYGYDHMADEVYNTPLDTALDFGGQTCLQAVQSLGFTLASTSFPNNSYVLPSVTVGDMGEDVTARDVLGWICEICGCYARYNHLGKLEIKALGILSFGDDLDGGTWEDYELYNVDDADGGFFSGAYGRNKLPIPYTDGTKVANTLHWYTVTDTASQILVYGSALGEAEFMLQDEFTLPPGRYRLSGIDGGSLSTYCMKLYRYELYSGSYRWVQRAVCFNGSQTIPNSAAGTPYFTVNSGDKLRIRIIVESGTNMGSSYATGTLMKPMILDASDGDSYWEYYMKAWTAGDDEDGGLFGFWNRSGVTILTEDDAHELSKIMQEPTVSNVRFMVTGVSVKKDEIEESVGTNDYMIEIQDNPFITTWQVAQAIASQVYSVLSGVNFYPFSISWSADPSFEAGDLISFYFMKKKFVTVCTSFDYTLGNMSTISCNESDLNNKVDY